MDALEYKQWQETFQSKAHNATDDEIGFALNDIREALAYKPIGSYEAKLLLERAEFLTEASRRSSKAYRTEYL